MVLTIIKRFLVTEEFFELNLKFLFFVGLWPYEVLSTFRRKAYKVYEIILHFFMILFLIITGIGTLQCKDNIVLFLSNVDKSVGFYNYFFKVICFVSRRDELVILIDDIMKSGDKVTDGNKNNMIKLLVATTSLGSFVVLLFSLAGFYNNEMTVHAWMPFDPYESKMNLALSGQILAGLFVIPLMYRAMAMQGIICSLLIYLCDQLTDLQKKIRSLKLRKEYESAMKDELVLIMKKHIRLLGYSNALEIMFRKYFVIQNLAVTLELCINAVLVTTITRDQMSVIFGFLVYLALALLNAYVYCYLGNDLVEQSESIAKAAYDAEWLSWPVDLQKNMLLIITVAQRPFRMTAGAVVVIDIQNFATALYNGYSIFAVLNDAVN